MTLRLVGSLARRFPYGRPTKPGLWPGPFRYHGPPSPHGIVGLDRPSRTGGFGERPLGQGDSRLQVIFVGLQVVQQVAETIVE
jgi:hypothetical protein